MGVISSYLLSSIHDGVLPHLRPPVERIFDAVVVHKGLPTRADFRELRNRVDMLDYQCREATKLLHEVRGRLRRSEDAVVVAQGHLAGAAEEI